jgi:hypothetical protein
MSPTLWYARIAMASAKAGRGLCILNRPCTDLQYEWLTVFGPRYWVWKTEQMNAAFAKADQKHVRKNAAS